MTAVIAMLMIQLAIAKQQDPVGQGGLVGQEGPSASMRNAACKAVEQSLKVLLIDVLFILLAPRISNAATQMPLAARLLTKRLPLAAECMNALPSLPPSVKQGVVGKAVGEAISQWPLRVTKLCFTMAVLAMASSAETALRHLSSSKSSRQTHTQGMSPRRLHTNTCRQRGGPSTEK